MFLFTNLAASMPSTIDKGNMADQETFSVIIVNHNSDHHLAACVQSLIKNTGEVPIEVIIIDNASTDGSIGQVSEAFPALEILANSRNVGFAAACNQGLRQARGGTILLLNPDTIIQPDAVKDTLEFLARTPEAGIAGCRLLNTDGRPWNSCRTFPTVWDYLFDSLFLTKLFPGSRLFGRLYLTNTRFAGPTEVDVVSGAFFMFKRAVMDDIGLLDERYFIYTEERDFCYRAKAAGWKVYFYPQAEIIHMGRVSTRQHALEMFIEQKKSMIRFHQKFDTPRKTNLIRFLIILGIFIRFLVWNIAAAVSRTPEVISRRHVYTGATRWFLWKDSSCKVPQGMGN